MITSKPCLSQPLSEALTLPEFFNVLNVLTLIWIEKCVHFLRRNNVCEGVALPCYTSNTSADVRSSSERLLCAQHLGYTIVQIIKHLHLLSQETFTFSYFLLTSGQLRLVQQERLLFFSSFFSALTTPTPNVSWWIAQWFSDTWAAKSPAWLKCQAQAWRTP